MFQTITLGTCVSVQGLLVERLPNGRVVIRVGDRTYEGKPVIRAAAPPSD
jgi:hypothetical protein